eukprot:gene13181-9480_t
MSKITDEERKNKPWTDYGELMSPFTAEQKKLYDNQRRTALLTNTNDYLDKRNKLLNTLLPEAKLAYKKTFDSLKSQGVPYAKMRDISIKVGKQKFEEIANIVESVYPNGDAALKKAANMNMVQEMVNGNLMGSEPAKKKRKGGRPP